MLAIFLAFITATGFSVNSMFVRIGAQRVNTRTGTAINAALSLIVAAVPALILDLSAFSKVPLVGFLWLLLVGLLSYPIGNLLNYTSVNRIGMARAVPLWSSAPIFAVILAVIFLDERPNPAIVLGIVAVIIGMVLIVTERSGAESTAPMRITRGVVLGYVCGLSAAVAYGSSTFMIKILVTDYATPLVTATFSVMFGLLMLAPLVASDVPRAFREHRRFATMFVFSGIAGGIGSLSIFFALERGDLMVVTPIISTSPLITLILAHLFLQRLEKLTIPIILGAILVVGGTALVVVGDRL